MNPRLFPQDQSFYRYHEENERLLRDPCVIQGFQGIWDDGFTHLILYRRDVCCPENRSDADEEGGISHVPSKTNPAIKGRNHEKILE